MDRLLAMESFVVAVDLGSLSAAAERMGVAKSVMSKRIADLETHVGASLLVRTARGLSLTSAGSAYHRDIGRLLGALTEAEQTAAGSEKSPKGTLRIAAPMSFGTLQLRKIISRMMVACPGLIIDLDMNDRYVDVLAEGYDLAIRIGELDDTQLVARKIAPNRQLLCASAGYIARKGMPIAPKDLKDHDGLLYMPREPHGMLELRNGGSPASYRVGTRLRCNNGEMLIEAALAGLGVAILPAFLMAEHLKDGSLLQLLPGYEASNGHISVVFPRERQASAKVRLFIDTMLRAFAPTSQWDTILGECASTVADREEGQ